MSPTRETPYVCCSLWSRQRSRGIAPDGGDAWVVRGSPEPRSGALTALVLEWLDGWTGDVRRNVTPSIFAGFWIRDPACGSAIKAAGSGATLLLDSDESAMRTMMLVLPAFNQAAGMPLASAYKPFGPS